MKNKKLIFVYLIYIVIFFISTGLSSLFKSYSDYDYGAIRKLIKEKEIQNDLSIQNVIYEKLNDYDVEVNLIFKDRNDLEVVHKTLISAGLKGNIYDDLLYKVKSNLYFSFIFLIIWFLPLYKGQKNSERRIVSFSVFVFFLCWFVFFFDAILDLTLFLKYSNLSLYHSLLRIITAFLCAGSISSFLNVIINDYILKKYIAKDFFKENSPYSHREGKGVNLSTKIWFFTICLGIIPLILFSKLLIEYLWQYIELMFKDYKYVIEHNDVVVISSVLMILFFTFLIVQIVSTIFMKKQLHDPLNILRQNMKKVGEGDLSSRIQVNDNDEIGSLQAYFNDMVEGLEERQKIKDIFGKFVSGEICDKLLQKGNLSLDGDEVITTVMFTDIRDFTPLSENMTPKELIRFMNRYFSYIVKPIMDENGIVNKFIGDAVMAIFSPVFELDKHAEAALKAALKMRTALDEFNLENKVDVKQGIGLHTGKLVVGNVGTEERMEFTVLGDNVNIAARIESQTKELKTDILMSEDFYNELELSVFDDYNFIKYENIQMKGKTDNFVLYGVERKI